MKKSERLGKLKKKMKADKSLPLQVDSTNLVFGEGNPDAEIMFIGEGPGYWEDKKARPFVGNAGAFLNQLLQLIKVPREEVFITNVVNYRPPQNRDPENDEIEAFQPYLDKMIDIIEPKIIVTLGRFSMAKFIPGVFISSVHGKPKKINWKGRDVIVVPMYHPAAGLRNGMVRQKTMSDFRKLQEVLGSIEDEEPNEKVEKEKQTEQMQLV